jgi:hypothetical protein
MSSNTYGGFVVLAVFVIIGGLFVRQWRRADVSLDESRGEVRYERPVLVRVRRLPDERFHDLTAGFGSLVLTIRGGIISIRLPEFPRHLAATLSVDYTFRASEVLMYVDTVGWGGSSLLRKESVILTGEDAEGPLQLAIAPRDKDVGQLFRALTEAGVLGES